jgi:hypothetical protein
MFINQFRLDRARSIGVELGQEHGKSAASWFSCPDADTANSIISKLDNCDPEIYDSLPCPDLSGEWSGVFNGHDMLVLITEAFEYLSYAMSESDYEHCLDELSDEACTSYEGAFHMIVEKEVIRVCQYQLGD